MNTSNKLITRREALQRAAGTRPELRREQKGVRVAEANRRDGQHFCDPNAVNFHQGHGKKKFSTQANDYREFHLATEKQNSKHMKRIIHEFLNHIK